MPGNRPYSGERFRELLLYIAERMEQTGHVGRGRIKLAKLLWLCDFEAYLKLGRSITGAQYHKDNLGPSPRAELLEARTLNPATEFAYEPGFDKQKLPVAKRPPHLALFEQREISLAAEVVDRYRQWTTDRLVHQIAHEHPGFKTVGFGKPVPYESVFVSTDPPPDRAVQRGRELVSDGRWGDIPF